MNPEKIFASLTEDADKDSAVVAVLRRSASHEAGLYPPAFRYIEPYVYGLGEWRRKAVYLAASCWAQTARRENSQVMALPIAVKTLKKHHTMGSQNVDTRFTALLDADTDELQWRLRHLTSQMAAAAIGIDWPTLLKDLWAWNSQDRHIQIKWARQFWSDSSTASVTDPAVISPS